MSLRATACGPFPALFVTGGTAVLVPVPEGEKVTLMLQFAPGESEVPQLLPSVKSPLKLPVRMMAEVIADAGNERAAIANFATVV
jgi:hypothetical protein